jgi:hypothetical protein
MAAGLQILTPTSCVLPVWVRGLHLRGRNYTAVNRFFVFKADGSFAGTQETTRDIELSSSADEYTATATFEFFDAADQLIRTGCATSTATRLE